MTLALRKVMDVLYLACAVIAGCSLVLISAVIPWGVYTRYVINRTASWPEPMAVLLTIVLTFFGAAACYRSGAHMRVSVLVRMMPGWWRRLAELLSESLVGLLSLFMLIWGIKLVEATWYQVIDAFPFLSVGVTYLPIPIGGLCLLLFIIERIFLGLPPDPIGQSHSVSID